MSTKVVDNKVVSMEFDNSKFEKNVDTSLSTIDKLKKSLKFENVNEGFDKIRNSAKDINFNGMNDALVGVKANFSAMEIIGITALSNITTAAMRAGESMVRSLTIDQVTAGFEEYELKMGSVQTIMASTGESLETVNRYLYELNKYSDQTIYSFSDMTTNIGKFTNAGVKLEDAVAAIKGISNEAAVSGANAQEASRAMYNFAQALSAGYVKLIDWKSIENANMATVEFKEELLKTAEDIGTVTKTVDGYYQVLTTNASGSVMADVISSTRNFNDSLAYQWMTTDVLVETLNRYADSTTTIGAKAQAAATEVKTFSMLMDTLKEAVGSGWAESFELIVGDFNLAKKTFTELSNYFGGIIDKVADARNAILSEALRGKFEQLTEKIQETGISFEEFEKVAFDVGKERGLFDKSIDNIEILKNRYGSFKNSLMTGWMDRNVFIETMERMAKTTTTVIESVEDFGDVVDRVINGEFGHGADRINKLTEAGYNYAQIQNLVNEKLGSTIRREFELAEAELISEGYTEEQIAAFKELAEQARETNTPISELLDNMKQKSGRDLLIDSIKNSWHNVEVVVKAVGEAWSQTFKIINGSDLYGIIRKLADFTARMRLTDEDSQKLVRTFRGLFAVIKTFKDISSSVLSGAIKIIGALFGVFDDNVLSVTASIGDLLTGLTETLGVGTTFRDVVGAITDKIVSALRYIREWSDANINFSISFQDVANFANEAWDGIKGFVESTGVVSSVTNGAKSALDYLSNTIKTLKDRIPDMSSALSNFSTKLKDAGTISDKFKVLLSYINKFLDIIIPGSEEGTEKVEQLGEALDNVGESKGFAKLQDKVSGVFEFFKGLVQKLKDLIPDNFFGTIFPIAGQLVFLATIIKITHSIYEVVDFLHEGIAELSESIQRTLKSARLYVNAQAFKVMAEAILILAAAVGLLTFLFKVDRDATVAAVISIGLIMAEMAIVFSIVNANAASGIKASGLMMVMLLSFAGAIAMLVFVSDLLTDITFDELTDSILKMGEVIAVMAGALYLLSKIPMNGSGLNGLYSMVGFAVAMYVLVEAVNKFSQLDLSGLSNMHVKLLVGMMVSLGLIMAASGAAGKYAMQGGASLILVAVAMNLLIGVIKKVIDLDITELTADKVWIMVGLVTAVGVLMLLTSKAGASAAKGGFAILAMVISMNLLLGLIESLKKVGKGNLGKAVAMLGMLLGAVSIMMAITKLAGQNSLGGSAAILAMSVALITLTGSLFVLSQVKSEDLVKAVSALSIVMLAFGGMAKLAGSMKKDAIVPLIVMAASLIVLVGSIYALSYIDKDKLEDTVKALTVIMIAFGAMAKLCSGISLNKGAIVGIAVLGIITMGLTAILAELTQDATNLDGALKVALGVSTLLIAMSAACLILSKINKVSASALVAMGILTVIVGALAGILYLFTKNVTSEQVDNAVKIALALSGMLAVLSGVMLILTVVGLAGGAAISGAASLGAVIAIIVGVVGSIAGLFGVLGTFIDETAGLKDKIINGIQTVFDILGAVSHGFGELLGQFISGIADGLVKGMTSIAIDLVQFMNAINPFFEKIKAIDEGTLNACKNFIDIIKTLAKAEAWSAVANIASFFAGDESAEKFSSQLGAFGDGIAAFSTSVKNGQISTAAVEAACKAGAMICDLAKQIPNEGGLIGRIFGENDAEVFGSKLESFGKGISKFSSAISENGGIDTTACENAAKAIKPIVELAQEIPNAGGKLAELVGDNQIDSFGSKLEGFGIGIMSFSKAVSDNGGVNSEACERAANAIKPLIELSRDIPNSGGILAELFGDNDMETFADDLDDLGAGIKTFYDHIEGITKVYLMSDVVDNVGKLADSNIINFINDIAYTNLETFKENMMQMGIGFKYFINATKSMSEADFESIAKAITDIVDTFLKGEALAKTSAKKVANLLIEGLSANKEAAKNAGDALLKSYLQGMTNDAMCTAAAKKDIDSINTVFNEHKDDAIIYGEYYIQGFIEGTNHKIDSLKKAIQKITKTVNEEMEDGLGEKSPSKITEQYGVYYDQGFERGVDKGSGSMIRTVGDLADRAVNAMGNAISTISQRIQNGMDDELTIRPVLDLSDVEAGAGRIHGLLGGNYGVRTNLNSISSYVNQKKAMSTNADVVSALDGLTKKVSGINANNYTINGITYDNGSEIQSAVETLIRAARIERRM